MTLISGGKCIDVKVLAKNCRSCDGDTKSLNEICKSDPYRGQEITKGECIGRLLKRVGTRLRTIKSNYAEKVVRW